MLELEQYIRSVPDFPKPGILFRDITPLLNTPEAFRYALSVMQENVASLGAEGIVAIESRGFIFGAPLAESLGLPLIPIRKVGKLPGKTRSVSYSLEYGSSELQIHEDALTPQQRVVIVDDLLATGGTAAASAKLVESLSAQVIGCIFLIELTSLAGRAALENYAVSSLLQYE